MSQPSNYSAIKDALEVFAECIKNGNEIKNLCEKCSNATIKSHPIFKKLVDKIADDTKAIEKLSLMIDDLQKSADGNDYKKWRADFGQVINSLETASNDTIVKLSHAVASSGAKKVKKKFEEIEKIISDTDVSQIKDEAGRNFLIVLIERNRKIVECLKYAESLLPKFFKLPQIDIPRITFKKNRKLFIIGDDNSKSMSFNTDYDHLGEVIIKSSLPSSTGLSSSQSAVFRNSLNGYLIEDLDRTEVKLKLIEPANNSMNLIEFSRIANSSEYVKLSATIEINGEVDENVEVVEICVTEGYQMSKGPEAMAIVENSQTGDLNKVPIQIVPVTPEKEIHGKIIEIQPMTEQKDKTEILDEVEMPSFNSTFKEDSPMKGLHYATPSRKDRDVRQQVMSQYYTPLRDRRDRLNYSLKGKPVGQQVMDQLIDNAADKIVNLIIQDQSNLEDVSEIEYANLSSYYEPNQSVNRVVPERISNKIVETSGKANLEDISEIEYANLSDSFHPNQSARNATMPSPQRVINTSGIRRTPNRTNISLGKNLEDISEIEYANISSVYEPNMSNRSRVNNVSIKSPQRRVESSMRREESRLEDVSEIEYVNMSSINQSLRNRSVPKSPKSPQRRINTSMMRQDTNLEDISEIEYANLSGSFHPNQSVRNDVIVSPQRTVMQKSPQRRLNISARENLQDISEIEYANLSGSFHPNQSVRNQVAAMSPKSPGHRRLETSVRENLQDISEIEYANLSGSFHPNQSVRNDVIVSPQRTVMQKSPQRRLNISARENLQDISEIEYANMSSIYEPNQSNRSRGNNMSMASPRRIPETSMRRHESRLEDISEIEYADMSSVNQSVRNRSVPMSPKSPQRRINTSMMRQDTNLEDISEIEYANLSGSFHPNQSVRNQVAAMSPKSPGQRRLETSVRENLQDISEIEYANLSGSFHPNQSDRNQMAVMSPKSPQRRMEASMRDNLEDISEIEYADLSGPNYQNQSIRNQQSSFRSPQQRMQTSVRQSPRNPVNQQPAEGILIDITSTPPKTPQRNVVFNDGNLIQFDNEAARQSVSRQPRRSGNLKELMRTLHDVLNDDFSTRLKRREKVHDRSLPYSKPRSVNKMMNTSIPSRMPVTSNRIVFERPPRADQSRIHEDALIPMTTVVVDRPREVLSPLRPHEAQRINRLLETTVNPFANNMLQVPQASRSFYEDSGNSSFDNRNTSLPSHLTPRKEKLPPMDQSFTAAWEETQRSNQVENDEEDLENISDPFSASMDDGPINEYSYKDDLENVSMPFSDSFNEMYDSVSNLPQQLPVQSPGQFLSRFEQKENLDNVSFELADD